MAQYNLQQDFNAEQEQDQEEDINFDTIFEDFLNETDTANDDLEDFVIGQGQEDTITHIIQLDMLNELDILNGFHINYDLYPPNNDWVDRPLTPEEDRRAGLHLNFPRRLRMYNEDNEELEPLEQDAEPALLFCNIDYDNITDIHANVNEDDDDTEEQEEEDEDDLLQYILDDDDVIPYDCPVEADAFYAD